MQISCQVNIKTFYKNTDVHQAPKAKIVQAKLLLAFLCEVLFKAWKRLFQK